MKQVQLLRIVEQQTRLNELIMGDMQKKMKLLVEEKGILEAKKTPLYRKLVDSVKQIYKAVATKIGSKVKK